jgi:tryptophanyl-tRNA synthetase
LVGIIQDIENEWKNSDTFKLKNKRKEESVSIGLFDYPVLMASDILLYDTDEVPVGEDQKQHVEITRDIAERVNNRFGEIFVIPKPVIQKEGARIMNLQDPTKKMSKSDENPNSRIEVLDSPEIIRQKIARAVTDSDDKIRYDIKNKPGISNLLSILSVISETSIPELEKKYENSNYGGFKNDIAEAIIGLLEPFQARFNSISDEEVRKVLKEGAKKIEPRAKATLERLQKAIGLGI